MLRGNGIRSSRLREILAAMTSRELIRWSQLHERRARSVPAFALPVIAGGLLAAWVWWRSRAGVVAASHAWLPGPSSRMRWRSCACRRRCTGAPTRRCSRSSRSRGGRCRSRWCAACGRRREPRSRWRRAAPLGLVRRRIEQRPPLDRELREQRRVGAPVHLRRHAQERHRIRDDGRQPRVLAATTPARDRHHTTREQAARDHRQRERRHRPRAPLVQLRPGDQLARRHRPPVFHATGSTDPVTAQHPASDRSSRSRQLDIRGALRRAARPSRVFRHIASADRVKLSARGRRLARNSRTSAPDVEASRAEPAVPVHGGRPVRRIDVYAIAAAAPSRARRPRRGWANAEVILACTMNTEPSLLAPRGSAARGPPAALPHDRAGSKTAPRRGSRRPWPR